MPVFEKFGLILDAALGLQLNGHQLSAWQMCLRAVIVFVAATAMIRLGDERFMGKSTALDVMLGIVYGSLMSRAITGNAAFFPTLASGLALVLVHWSLSAIAFRSHAFGRAIKGYDVLLVKKGEIQWGAMRRCHITEHDLIEALRVHGKEPNLDRIYNAHLERNGAISIIDREG